MGSVQKQAPYDPKTLYRFPDVKRCGKVDIFQRIGTCDISWSCDDQETRVCEPVGANRGDSGMKLKVTMTRLGAAALKSSEAADKTAAKSAKAEHTAKSAKYISERGVENMLTAAMRALLKQMPADAPEFLCNFIDSNYGSGKRQKAQKSARESAEVGSAEYYRQNVLPCSQDYFGQLHRRSQWPNRGCQSREAKQKADREALAQKLVTALRTGGMESAMMHLAWQADQAKDLGSFEDFLECFKQKKAEAEEEQLRMHARSTLVEAAQNGGLREVLTDMFADGMQAPKLEELREQMSKVLTSSALDGSLEKMLSKPDELRSAVSNAYSQAHAKPKAGRKQTAAEAKLLPFPSYYRANFKGTSAEVFCRNLFGQQVRPTTQARTLNAMQADLKQAMIAAASDGQQEERREKLKEAMMAAASDGTLQKALALNSLTKDLQATMMSAVDDGSLQSTLAQRAEKQAGKRGFTQMASVGTWLSFVRPDPQKASMDCMKELRLRASGVFGQAYNDGSLEKALKDLGEPTPALSPSQVKMTQALVAAASDGSLHSALARRAGKQADSSSERNLLQSTVMQQCVKVAADERCAKVGRGLLLASMNGSLQDHIHKLAGKSGMVATNTVAASSSSAKPRTSPPAQATPQVQQAPSSAAEETTLPPYLFHKCVEVVGDELRATAARQLLITAMNGDLQKKVACLGGRGGQAEEELPDLASYSNEDQAKLTKIQAGARGFLERQKTHPKNDAKGGKEPAVAALSPFTSYYKRNILQCVACSFPGTEKAAQKGSGAVAAKGVGQGGVEQKHWQVRPSVGTWLRPRRKPCDNATADAFDDGA
jgi:hypothetical protein